MIGESFLDGDENSKHR
jgi:hypothetical protein